MAGALTEFAKKSKKIQGFLDRRIAQSLPELSLPQQEKLGNGLRDFVQSERRKSADRVATFAIAALTGAAVGAGTTSLLSDAVPAVNPAESGLIQRADPVPEVSHATAARVESAAQQAAPAGDAPAAHAPTTGPAASAPLE